MEQLNNTNSFVEKSFILQPLLAVPGQFLAGGFCVFFHLFSVVCEAGHGRIPIEKSRNTC
jgi:hypothetical protein